MTHNRIFYQVSISEPADEEFQKLAAQLGARIEREYKRRKVTPEDQAEMRRLFTEEGIPSAVIGERFRLSPASMSQYLRGYKRKKAPKEAKPKRQVGRPKLTEDEKQVRLIGNQILGYYSNRKEKLHIGEPKVYEEFFATQEQCLRLAIVENDLATVQWFNDHKPWTRFDKSEPPNLAKEMATPPEAPEPSAA